MEVNGFNENGLSEKSKEALQSETWNQARAAIKTEIQHFTASRDGTVSLADTVAGNIPDPTLEEVEAAEAENTKLVKDKAKEKLEAELKSAKEKDFADPIINYLLQRCSEDEGLAADVVQKYKTWTKCLAYLFEKAKKMATENNCAAVRSDKVFEWAEDYYHKDDKDEEEKKAKKAVEQKKMKSENAKEKTSAEPVSKKKTADTKPEKKAAPKETKKDDEPKQKKSSKDMDGQMDLFSLMGM